MPTQVFIIQRQTCLLGQPILRHVAAGRANVLLSTILVVRVEHSVRCARLSAGLYLGIMFGTRDINFRTK